MQIQQRAIAAAQRPVGDAGGGSGIGDAEREQTAIQRMQRHPLLPQLEHVGTGQARACYVATVLSVGSFGSVTLVSRSKPSFSSLMCSIAMALALASRSGSAWYSETQQR